MKPPETWTPWAMRHLEEMEFGCLKVLRREGPENGTKTRWLCQCACGNTRVVRGDHLRTGSTRSCGCAMLPEPAQQQEPGGCAACGKTDRSLTRGWCERCLIHWYRDGCPGVGPQPSFPPERALDPEPAEVSDLAAGTAAEYLVCADLLLQGYQAFMASQGCRYDVAADLGRLVRIQVKATRKIRRLPGREHQVPAYHFKVGRSVNAQRRPYDENSFDLLAFVALDIREIAYFPPMLQPQAVYIRTPGDPAGRSFADYPFAKAVAELGLAG